MVLLKLYCSLDDIEKYLEYKRSKAVPFDEVKNYKIPLPRLKFYCDKIDFNIDKLFLAEALFIPEFENNKVDIDKKKQKLLANFSFKIKMANDASLPDLDELYDTLDEGELYEYYRKILLVGLHYSIDYFLELYDLKNEYNYVQKNKKELSPLEFEKDICIKLKKFGFRAETTKASGDQGVDVIAERNDIKFAIQCKFYSSPVGNKAVQEVCAGRDFYDADYGVVVTNNTYTPAAKKLADKNEIILLNDSELEKLLKLCE